MNTVYIVVPCYNEEDMLPETASVLGKELHTLQQTERVSPDSRLLFVDDGSTDRTWHIIEGLCRSRPEVCGLKLRCNRGHQNAVMAGLLTAAEHADAAISIDADLQDDPTVIVQMVDQFNGGVPIVCGVRRSRSSDSFFKRFTARGFYLLVRLGGAKVIYDHADFRLMSKEAIRRLSCFGTEDLFLRGLITRLDLPIGKVRYDRAPRAFGETKYTMKKMLHLARRGFESGKAEMAAEPQIGDLHIEKELLQ